MIYFYYFWKTVPILLLLIKTCITCYNYILLLSHAFVLEKTPVELIRNWNWIGIETFELELESKSNEFEEKN